MSVPVAAPGGASVPSSPEPPRPAAERAAAEDDTPCCIICMESEETPQTGRLYRPCLCSLVHAGCLARWRAGAADATRCPTCKCAYRIGRERWARVLGHPAAAVAATAICVAVPVTIVAELARFALGIPRPAGVQAQLMRVLMSAWRGAEVASGICAYGVTILASVHGTLDHEGTDLMLRFSSQWVSGNFANAWTRGVAWVGTGALCVGTVGLVHHYIRENIRAKLMQAADRVLDISE